MADDFADNGMMDEDSRTLLSDLSSEYASNYAGDEVFQPGGDNVTGNASLFAGVDTFALQYLEEKGTVTQQKSTMEKVLNFPGLFLRIFGVDDVALLNAWNSAIFSLLVFLIGIYVYKAIKTGEVDG